MTFKDLTFENASVNIANGSGAAVVLGLGYGNTIFENITIKNSTVQAATKAGLLQGFTGGSKSCATVKSCTIKGSIVKANYSAALLVGLIVDADSFSYTVANISIDDASKFVWTADTKGEGFEEKGVKIGDVYYSKVGTTLWLTDPGEKCWAEKRVANDTKVYEGTTCTVKGSIFYPTPVAQGIVVNDEHHAPNTDVQQTIAAVEVKDGVDGQHVSYEVVNTATGAKVTEAGVDDRLLDFATLGSGVYTLQAKVTEGEGASATVKETTEILEVSVIQVVKQATTILAVPFKGVDAQPVTVATFFNATAAGLANGDTMSVYDTTKAKYVSFAYADGAWTSADEEVSDVAAYTLAPGSAVVLKSSGTGTANVTLVGTAPAASEVVTPAIADKSVGIAVNLTTAPKKVSEITAMAGTQAKDSVYLFVPTASGTLQFVRGKGTNAGKWVKPVINEVTIKGVTYKVQSDAVVSDTDTIPAGTGYWVQNASGAAVEVK